MSGARGIALAASAMALGACAPQEAAQDAGLAASPGTATAPDPAARALQLRGCRSDGSFPDVAGAWLVRFETTSTISGPALPGQGELVTRFGVAELCQDGLAVDATVLVCVLHQSAVTDSSGTCAAQMPDPQLVADLPAIRTGGRLSGNSPQPQLTLAWSETWGLAEGAALPAEPSGVAQVEPEGVVDQDGDARPGVTLRGDGAVPTEVWAARETLTQLVVEQGDELVLLGRTAGTTTRQTVLGGPATRVIRGRQRQGLDGALAWVRADGRSGAPRVDADGDGRLTCAELAPYIGTVLAAPLPDPCER